jgi:hypothetical protein
MQVSQPIFRHPNKIAPGWGNRHGWATAFCESASPKRDPPHIEGKENFFRHRDDAMSNSEVPSANKKSELKMMQN